MGFMGSRAALIFDTSWLEGADGHSRGGGFWSKTGAQVSCAGRTSGMHCFGTCTLFCQAQGGICFCLPCVSGPRTDMYVRAGWVDGMGIHPCVLGQKAVSALHAWCHMCLAAKLLQKAVCNASSSVFCSCTAGFMAWGSRIRVQADAKAQPKALFSGSCPDCVQFGAFARFVLFPRQSLAVSPLRRGCTRFVGGVARSCTLWQLLRFYILLMKATLMSACSAVTLSLCCLGAGFLVFCWATSSAIHGGCNRSIPFF